MVTFEKNTDKRVPLVPAGNGSFAVYRTPEQGHDLPCQYKAITVALENMRDMDAQNAHDFRMMLQDNTALVWADMYLVEGMTECLCDPIPVSA